MNSRRRIRSALLKGVNRARRYLAAAIEPSDPEPDPTWDVPIKLSLQCAKALREHLAIDENEYLLLAAPAWADSRAYVLYTVLDEVKKSSIHLMQLRDLLSGPPVVPREDRISRLVFTEVVENQTARERRLLEVLLSLILFQTSNENPYFRELLLLEDLEDLLGANLDLSQFYGAPSANVDESIDNRLQEVASLAPEIDPSRAWYRHPDLRSGMPPKNKLRPGKLLSSFRARLKTAIPQMRAHEKLVFGFSYAGYSNSSESIHYSVNPRDYRLRSGQETSKALSTGLLAFSILDRAHELLGRPSVPALDQLARIVEQAQPIDAVHAATAKNVRVGDFVLAYGDLAEVLETRETDFGYRSYRVRYIAERPKPGILEDWFPAFRIQPFYTRERFKERLQEMAAAGKLPADAAERMGSLTDAELQPLIRASLKNTWDLGLRDWVRGGRKRSPTP